MIKLYGGPRTRAGIVQWYLEELGLAYELVVVDLKAGAQHEPEYRAINPIGKVPALDDDGVKIWESGAILLYLADKYGKTAKTPQERANLYAWVLYANATLTPALLDEKNREALLKRAVEPLNAMLSSRQFLVGSELTAADVAVGSVLGWSAIVLKVDYSAFPAVMAYAGRLAQRPAFQKAMGG
ncbi:MAG TPA: glutathione S-transferase family protein [Haliangium sp.]|nr:glutathione S-transferase family protein [Haliangium sp.]